jgi:predicted phosphodiesterase
MLPRVLASWTLVAAAFLATTAWAADGVQKGPYLQHLGSTSVDVDVELAAPTGVSVVVVAQLEAGAAAKPVKFESPSATFHAVHVSGLTPATRYTYDVHVAHGQALRGTFATAPADASRAPFTFVVYGDNRTDGPAHERVVHAIAAESYDFLVHTGDFVIEGDDEKAWQVFFDIEEPILRDHCLFACVGNHELFNDREAAHFERYFGPVALAGPTAPPSPIYGTFRWGRARFFLLNAFTSWADGPERAWLDDVLTRADHEAGVDVRVVVMHQGLYSAGPHGGSKAILAAHVDDLLVAHRVDLVVAGHDHIYERGEAKGLKYLVSGGGGAPLYEDMKRIPSTLKLESTYNYVLVTVTDEKVSTVAKRPDGSVIDACSFVRGSSWLCDPPKPVTTAAIPSSPAPAPTPARATQCGCDVAGRPSRSDAWVLLGAMLAFGCRRRRA